MVYSSSRSNPVKSLRSLISGGCCRVPAVPGRPSTSIHCVTRFENQRSYTKMAALRNVGRLSSAIFSVGRRCYCKKFDLDSKPPFTGNWMPGEYPTTQQERLAAAEKYGIHPDEYKPLPPTECAGDYPDLKKEGYDARDPLYPWDMPEYRRNWNEPMHEDDDMLGADKFAHAGVRQRSNPWVQSLIGILFFSISWIVMHYQGGPTEPLMKKQYIYIDDKPLEKSYTFDLK